MNGLVGFLSNGDTQFPFVAILNTTATLFCPSFLYHDIAMFAIFEVLVRAVVVM